MFRRTFTPPAVDFLRKTTVTGCPPRTWCMASLLGTRVRDRQGPRASLPSAHAHQAPNYALRARSAGTPSSLPPTTARAPKRPTLRIRTPRMPRTYRIAAALCSALWCRRRWIRAHEGDTRIVGDAVSDCTVVAWRRIRGRGIGPRIDEAGGIGLWPVSSRIELRGPEASHTQRLQSDQLRPKLLYKQHAEMNLYIVHLPSDLLSHNLRSDCEVPVDCCSLSVGTISMWLGTTTASLRY